MRQSLAAAVLACLIAAVAIAGFLHGSAFGTLDSTNVDLSINLVAAHALLDRDDPYGPSTLRERAVALGSPTALVYSQLFTSYIQPPTSALWLSPLTLLSWRQATHVYLVISHIFLAAALLIMLSLARPRMRWHWVLAIASVLVFLYSQIYTSFLLGQFDTLLMLLFVVAFWGYVRERPAITGSALAIGASIKLFPGLILLYFLWRRQYAVLGWAALVGGVLLVASALYLGPDIYKSYLTETLPATLRGSSHYSNMSFGALIARSQTPDVIAGLPEVDYLGKVSLGTGARVAEVVIALVVLAATAFVLGPGAPKRRSPAVLIWEFYLVITVVLIVSSVAWEFYVVWLIPAFQAVFVAPGDLLPDAPWRWLFLAGFVVALVGMNYPGDHVLFDNDFVHHPDYIPGIFIEDRIRLYQRHLDANVLLRLPSLMLTASLMGLLVLWRRRRDKAGLDEAEPVPKAETRV